MTEGRSTFAAALLVVIMATLLYAIHPQFFVKDDFQLEFLPGSRDVARAWTSGTLPLLSRHSWFGGALAAEYQFGVFSVFRALLDVVVWLLPLSLTGKGAFLFIAHAAVAAAGAFGLARSYSVSTSLAMMVAVVAALNGWILWWGTTWFPAIAAFAWLPWYWLALRGIREGSRWSWLGAALSLYLLLTAGSPYTVVMALVIAAMSFLAALLARRWRAALTMVGSSLLGLCLAAPAVLMLLEYFPVTSRSSMAVALGPVWVVPPLALLGFIVPGFTTTWPVFAGSLPHPAVELVGAFVPIIGIVVALATQRSAFVRRHLPELLVAVVLLFALMLPSPAPLRWSFHWLPLFHLVAAVVGACGLQNVPRAWARGTMPAIITIVMIVATFVGFSRQGEVPTWPYDNSLLGSGPLDPSRRYLAMYDVREVIHIDERERYTRGMHPELRPGNLPMLAGIELVNGYSPLGPIGLKNLFQMDVHGPITPRRAEHLLQREAGANELLHHMGVDGLIVPRNLVARHAASLSRQGWRPVAQLATCIVLHRQQPLNEPIFGAARAWKVPGPNEGYAAIFMRRTRALPVVLIEPGARREERYGRRAIGEVEESRHHTSFRVRGKGPKALVVFRRPWLPGWRATIGGKPLALLRADMVMPAVEIPADAEGEVRLVYRPRGLVLGAIIAGLAVIVVLVLSLRGAGAPKGGLA